MNYNRAIIAGRLGQDPDVKHTASGTAVAHLSIATTESWTNKNGEKESITEWHRATVWGKQAESCARFLKKGSSVLVEGRIETRKWQSKSGEERKSTEIRADRVIFGPNAKGGPAPVQEEFNHDDQDGPDIPF